MRHIAYLEEINLVDELCLILVQQLDLVPQCPNLELIQVVLLLKPFLGRFDSFPVVLFLRIDLLLHL